MKRIICLLFTLSSFIAFNTAQQAPVILSLEQQVALDEANHKAIIGTWKITGLKVMSDFQEILAKKEALEKAYAGVFLNGKWQFMPDGQLHYTYFQNGAESTESSTFTLTVQTLQFSQGGGQLFGAITIKNDVMTYSLGIASDHYIELIFKRQ